MFFEDVSGAISGFMTEDLRTFWLLHTVDNTKGIEGESRRGGRTHSARWSDSAWACLVSWGLGRWAWAWGHSRRRAGASGSGSRIRLGTIHAGSTLSLTRALLCRNLSSFPRTWFSTNWNHNTWSSWCRLLKTFTPRSLLPSLKAPCQKRPWCKGFE
jgi:hypothetical protein